VAIVAIIGFMAWLIGPGIMPDTTYAKHTIDRLGTATFALIGLSLGIGRLGASPRHSSRS